MSIIQKLKDATIPSLYSSVASLGVYYAFVDTNLTMNIPFGNMNVPVWAGVGASVFIGSEIGSLATEFVAPKIPMIKDFEGIEKMIVPPVLAGLATYGVMKGLISPDTEFKQAMLVGGGGNLVGQLVYDKL